MKTTMNTQKTDSIRELAKVDISTLKKMINSLSKEVWDKETKSRENDFDCFHHTQHIIFRFPNSIEDRTIVHDNPIWNVWKPFLLPILEKAVAPYEYKNGTIKAVMLARLKAGHAIDRHVDGSLSYYFLHKIHIPIQTNSRASFYIEPDTFFLKEGIAYEVNNVVTHGVKNEGEEDRIHLIFEYMDETSK